MLAHDPIDVAREIQKKTNKTTVAAKDGLIINPSSYSITLKQKTLKGFFG